MSVWLTPSKVSQSWTHKLVVSVWLTPSKVSQSWTHKPPSLLLMAWHVRLNFTSGDVGRREVDAAAVPFARLFCGQRSEYMWEDDLGETHTISQGEGGEQGDAMMPLLFSFDQHRALEGPSLDTRRTPSCVLDDTFFVSPPHRAGPIYDQCRHQNPRGQGPWCDRLGEGRSSCQPQRQSVAGIFVAH